MKLVGIFTLSLILLNSCVFTITTKDKDFVERYKPKYLEEGDNKTYPVKLNNVLIEGRVLNAENGNLVETVGYKGGVLKHKLGGYMVREGLELTTMPFCFNDLIYRMSLGEKTQILCKGKDAYRKNYSTYYTYLGQEQDLLLEVKLLEIHGQGRHRKYKREPVKHDEL